MKRDFLPDEGPKKISNGVGGSLRRIPAIDASRVSMKTGPAGRIRRKTMRDWRSHFRGIRPRSRLTSDEALRQVGMTVMGQPVGYHHVETIVDSIVAGLNLRSSDIVADLGCGNGLITERIAARVARIAGVDVSEGLIESARANHAPPNCTYHLGDLAELESLPVEGVAKAYSNGVLQHLSVDETRVLLGALIDQIGNGMVFFASGIPDRARIREFYNTPERWAYYERRMAEGTEQIGHWWERDELVGLCREFGLTCTPVEQPGSLYTSHYRFDARISSR